MKSVSYKLSELIPAFMDGWQPTSQSTARLAQIGQSSSTSRGFFFLARRSSFVALQNSDVMFNRTVDRFAIENDFMSALKMIKLTDLCIIDPGL